MSRVNQLLNHVIHNEITYTLIVKYISQPASSSEFICNQARWWSRHFIKLNKVIIINLNINGASKFW